MADLGKESISQLRDAVEKMHACRAEYVQSVPVEESHNGMAVWAGVVAVFDVSGRSDTTRAYAWSSPIDGSHKRRFFVVLHVPPIDSPLAAVQAAIVQEWRQRRPPPGSLD